MPSSIFILSKTPEKNKDKIKKGPERPNKDGWKRKRNAVCWCLGTQYDVRKILKEQKKEQNISDILLYFKKNRLSRVLA